MARDDKGNVLPMWDRFTLGGGVLSIEYPSEITKEDLKDINEFIQIWQHKIERLVVCVVSDAEPPEMPTDDQ